MAGVALGATTLISATIVYDLLLARVRRADSAYPSTDPTEQTWWFGYARDLTNLCGFIGYTTGFWALGWSLPHALLGGFLFTLVTYVLDYLYARALPLRRAELALAASLLVLVAAAILLGRPLEALFDGLTRVLF